MTKASTGNKSRERKAVKVTGFSEVGVKKLARLKRASSKIREGSDMDLEDPKLKKPQNIKKTSIRMRSLQIGLIRARHSMLVTEEQINEPANTESNDSTELKAKFAEEEKVFDDLLTAFQAEAA